MKKNALVTGGGRGIGHSIALALAKDGRDIIILDVLPEAAVEENLKTLRATGASVLYWRGDVTSAADRDAALDAGEQAFGALQILVNNAGVAPKVRADILVATEESYDFVMGINLKGPYFLTQAVANRMVANKRKDPAFPARIINISSVSATVASPSRGEYCLSKVVLTHHHLKNLGTAAMPLGQGETPK
ncbi:MAG: SDR family NAD(P)-dependent oxidoreductase, partial [bacterium]